jgi:hypothetical protein
VFGLVVGSVIGLVAGLVFGLVDLVPAALPIGLVFGWVFWLVFWLVFGMAMTKTCWPTYVLASLWLGARRRLPVRLMEFLDDAYRLGILRIVGPAYQFRHAALQDHLAPPRESLQKPAANPPTTMT